MFFRSADKNALVGAGAAFSAAYIGYRLYRKIQHENEFFETVKNGDSEKFLSLIEKDPNLIYIRNDKKRQALHIAALGNYQPPKGSVGKYKIIVDEILRRDKGIINNIDVNGGTPLHLAAQAADAEIISSLLAMSANPFANETTSEGQPLGWLPIHLAVCPRPVDDVRLINTIDVLLRHVPETLNARCADGRTPLFVATFSGHLAAVKKFIEYGADVNLPSYDQTEARRHGVDEKVQDTLLTPLHVAIKRYSQEKEEDQKLIRENIIYTLVKNAASLTLKDATGKTPLDYADADLRLKIAKIEEGPAFASSSSSPALVAKRR